jgi:hypothetical protein
MKDLNSPYMNLNFTVISVLGLVLLVTFISWNFMQSSKIPKEWKSTLTLRYTISHGLSGELSDYSITSDSAQVHTRNLTNNGIHEEKYSVKLSNDQLNKLLEVMRANQVDKMRIRKTDVTIYDGTSFSFHFREGSQFIVMLSNGANEELTDKDGARLYNVFRFIQGITQKQ